MIRLGYSVDQKQSTITEYCTNHGIKKVFGLSPVRMQFPCDAPGFEWIEYADIIRYRHYYRLLQEIDRDTLVVVNECLRTQNRYDLTYNCIRKFLFQTQHRIVFQHLPLIDTFDDFMVLFDFDTRSERKFQKWAPGFREEIDLHVQPAHIRFHPVEIPTDRKSRVAYEKRKRELVDGIGTKDPHTIPRNLYLSTGSIRLRHADPGAWYVGRNRRFKMPNLQTYRDGSFPHQYEVFEFCHNFVDFAEFLALSRQEEFRVLASDLKVDQWYLQRYGDWSRRLADAYSALS